MASGGTLEGDVAATHPTHGAAPSPGRLDGADPWVAVGPGPVLFLIDARTALEGALLRARVEATRPAGRFRAEPPGTPPPGSAAGVPYAVVPAHGTGAPDRIAAALGALAVAAPGRPVWLAPLRVLWQPDDRGGGGLWQDLMAARVQNPGPARQAVIARRDPGRVWLLQGPGATLDQVRARGRDAWPETHAEGEFVQRQALVALERAERQARGPRYKVPRLLPRDVFANEAFRAQLTELARRRGRPVSVLEDEAAACLAEMAAMQTPFTLDVLVALIRAMIRASHDPVLQVREADLERIARLGASRPLAFVTSHRSMLDIPALQLALFERDMPLPLIFGGINLNTPGLGWLAQRAGVVFLRRSFQDDEVYKLTFRRYVDYLIEKRFSLTWALEGTRSRTGKLLPPRYGLFSYVVEAVERTGLHEFTFVPVHIGFEQITEVGDYVREQQGRDKRAEGAGWFLRFLRPSADLGRIFLRFGEPLTLSDVVPQEAFAEGLDDPGRRRAVQKVAFECAVRMNDVTPITPTAVLTLILLAAGHRAQPLDTIRHLARAGIALVHRRGIEIVGDARFDDRAVVEETLARLHATGIVSYYDDGEERLYGITPDQHLRAAYYRNSIIHFFVMDSLLEVALLQAAEAPPGAREPALWTALDRLRDLLKLEFYFRRRPEFRAAAERKLRQRLPGWHDRLAEGPDAVRALLGRTRPLFAHAVLRTFVDAYAVVARALVRLGTEPLGDRRAFLSTCLRLGRQLRREERLFAEESVSRTLHETALRLAEQRNLAAGAPGARDRRRAFFDELQDLGARLDLVLELTMRTRPEEP